jgi:hypothetical protein
MPRQKASFIPILHTEIWAAAGVFLERKIGRGIAYRVRKKSLYTKEITHN